MKRIAVFLVFFVFLASIPMVYAHPPSDIEIAFEPKTKILHAVIIHKVSNPTSHYINKVDVALNGKEIITHTIFRQDNNDNQVVSYLIPDAKEGDVLSVEGYCNISGKLEKKITVK